MLLEYIFFSVMLLTVVEKNWIEFSGFKCLALLLCARDLRLQNQGLLNSIIAEPIGLASVDQARLRDIPHLVRGFLFWTTSI